ncbi:MAG TPA: glycosyltransferase family 2 protein [Planctomycetota bacterium]|nr:glycosyltransferase family 2 protein [Planctomycetota bacterium]
MADDVTVVMPAYNESAALESYLPTVVAHCREKGYALVVVDDGSDDGTAALADKSAARGAGVTALHHKVNRGYGAAIKTGVEAATTRFVVTIDADGQHRMADVDRLVETVVREDADMVVGGRKGEKSASAWRGFGKTLIRTFARLLMPVPIHDINSGLKIYRTDVARECLHLCPDSMSFSDVITLVFLNQRRRVLEVPIRIDERAAGKSTISTRTAFETVMAVLNILVLFNPMRIFLPMSIVCILAGVIWGVPHVLAGRGVSGGAMLAIMMGFISFFLGLIAQQLSLLRRSGAEPHRKDR